MNNKQEQHGLQNNKQAHTLAIGQTANTQEQQARIAWTTEQQARAHTGGLKVTTQTHRNSKQEQHREHTQQFLKNLFIH
jgi:hypothetical protein